MGLFFSWCSLSGSPEEMAPFIATWKRKAICRRNERALLTLTLCAGLSVWVESRDYKQNRSCTDACAWLIHGTVDLKHNKRTRIKGLNTKQDKQPLLKQFTEQLQSQTQRHAAKGKKKKNTTAVLFYNKVLLLVLSQGEGILGHKWVWLIHQS